MIEHLRGRERALEPLGWTGREAEWIALVCLHSGVFIRPQFCDYFETDRKQALRVVRALVERRAAIEGDSMMFLGGARLCRISSMAIYRALGVENIRHRRKARNSVLMRRLMSLDFVLEHPGLNWLPTEPEKVEFFEELGIRSRLLPRRIYYGDEGAKKRYFSLKLPIAGGADTVTFAYVDPGPEEHRRTQHMGVRACSALGCDPRQGDTGACGCHWRGTGYGFAVGSGATGMGGGTREGCNRPHGEAGDGGD